MANCDTNPFPRRTPHGDETTTWTHVDASAEVAKANAGEPLDFTEIGRLLGVTRARAWAMHWAAVKKLRAVIGDDEL